MVGPIDVGDRLAVGNDVAVELPVAPQPVGQQGPAGTGRRTVHRVIGAHDRPGLALDHGGPERRKIGVREIAGGRVDVVPVATGLRPGMDGEMFRRRDGPVIRSVFALQAANEGNPQPCGQIGVLAVCLLTPAPAGITKDVDVGRPDRQPGEPVGPAETMALGQMFGAELDADQVSDGMDSGGVERRGQADRLREYGGVSRRRHPMQPFIPPVVLPHLKAGNGRGVVQKL